MDAVNAAGCAESLDPSTSLVLSLWANREALTSFLDKLLKKQQEEWGFSRK